MFFIKFLHIQVTIGVHLQLGSFSVRAVWYIFTVRIPRFTVFFFFFFFFEKTEFSFLKTEYCVNTYISSHFLWFHHCMRSFKII